MAKTTTSSAIENAVLSLAPQARTSSGGDTPGASGSSAPIANAENMPRHASGKKSEPYLSRASNVDAAPAASGRRNKWAERGTHATGASINEITQTTRNMPLATISSDVVSLRGTRWRANIPTAINPTNTSDRSPRPKWR